MRERDFDSLSFGTVCRRVGDFASSTAGRERCLALRPLSSSDDAETALDQARDFARLISLQGAPPIGAFPDIRPHLQRAAVAGFVLDGESLVEVRAVLECLRRCRAFFRGADLGSLAPLVDDLPSFAPLAETLIRSLDHDGTVLDQASDELAAVRAAIRRLRDTLSRRLSDLIGRRGMADVVTDQYVTLRNDRFVIPVKAGSMSRIQGVVQDRSVSGETFFIEPLFAVELNNQLLAAVRDEEAIVRRILADLTALVRGEAAAIGDAVERLADIDCTAARAAFAAEYGCTRPEFSDGEIALRSARHPGLAFTGRPVTPIDILLPAERRALVITGPNTGGKTVALKTLGLAALMAQSGLLVPADDGARLPFFSDVFTDVGDEQNIERDLSTFSAHVANLREIIDAAGESSLILLDEPGVGTDPEEGAALAVGLLRYFETRSSRLAVTTHYRPVKVHAAGSAACQVCAVDFDVERLEPLYKLVYQSLGRSLALPIAERLGLQPEVLAAARHVQSDESRAFADVLERLEAARRDFEAEREELATERAQLERQRETLHSRELESTRLIEDLRERRQRAWKDELREAREFVRELKEKARAQMRALGTPPAQRAELARFVREQEALISEHADPNRATAPRGDESQAAGPTSSRPEIGDLVAVGERGIEGELLSVEGERAWVQRGTLRFEVPRAQLVKVGRRPRTHPEVRLGNAPAPAESEIMLVGLRSRQALERLESFLDRAAQTNRDSVRIVHGVGSGALQRAVRDYLSTSPYCAGFRAGEDGEGGAGVTVAKLA